MWMRSIWFCSSPAEIQLTVNDGAEEKSVLTFQSRTPRQPSPRTAKPRVDTKIGLIECKRHFGNWNFRKVIRDVGPKETCLFPGHNLCCERFLVSGRLAALISFPWQRKSGQIWSGLWPRCTGDPPTRW